MKKNYMHCVLRRSNGDTQVSWIPADFAEVGRFLKLKEAGEWKDGWEVIKTYPGLLEGAILQERERDYKNHRKATDI